MILAKSPGMNIGVAAQSLSLCVQLDVFYHEVKIEALILRKL